MHHKTRILLVEDDPVTSLMERQGLEAAGYRVIEASSGEEAVAAVEGSAEDIDLVLMDINLGPGMDGPEAARRILARRDLPLIFLSSHTEAEVVARTEEITNYGYVVKSSSFAVLEASIRMALRLYEAKRGLARLNADFEAANEELRSSLESLEDAHSRLARSEEKFEKAFRLSPDSINLNRLSDGVYLDVNDGFTNMTGYRREEVVGRSAAPGDLGVWVRAEDRERLVKGLSEKGEVSNLEAEFRRRDGSTLTGLMSAHLIEIEGESCLISVTRDLSDRKRLEGELEDSEQRFRLAFRDSPVGIMLVSLEGRVKAANESLCAMLGRRESELVGLEVTAFTHAGDLALTREMTRRVREREVPSAAYRKRYLRPDGAFVWSDVTIALAGTPVPGGDAAEGFFICHVIDVSEAKRAEEELDATRNRYLDLLNSIGEGFSYVDGNEVFTMANPACGRVFGVPAEELIGRSLYEFLDGEGRALIDAQTRVRAAGGTSEYVAPILRRDGVRRWIRVSAAPLGSTPGVYEGTSALFRDITEELEDKEALNRLVRNKEILMKELQHRVKNSLSIVSSLLGIAQGEIADHRAIEVLEDTRSRVDSMSAIYERLYLSESVSTLDFGAYAEGLARSVLEAFGADPSRVALRLELERRELDTKRAIALGLIVNELLTNAVKYAFPGERRGGILVGFSLRGTEYRLSVVDDGVGLDPSLPLTSPTMGMTLIRLLAEKELGGRVGVLPGPGTGIFVAFPA